MMGVYKITLHGEVVYIGSSKNMQSRWAKHRSKLRLAKQNGDYQQSYSPYLCELAWINDLSDFKFDVLEHVDDYENLEKRERYWIRELGFPRGNTLIPNADGEWTTKPEFIEKHIVGENNPNYGHKWTQEMKNAASKRVSDGRYLGEKNPNFGNRGAKNPITKHVCPYNVDELKDKLAELGGFCALAKQLDIPRASVQIWCKNYGIPYKKRDYVKGFGIPEPMISKEQFVELNKTMTYVEMAAYFGVTKSAIEKWSRELGVARSANKRG